MFGDPNDPLTQILAQGQFAQPAIPTLPPEAAQSTISQLGQRALGGLGYVGDVLDKTFGGRAIRSIVGGLTGGKFDPTELLSVLPGSDTLGITDQANRVTGKQILQNLGVVSKNQTPGEGFSTDDLLGIGTEMALDPASWVGAAVPKLVARGLGGASRGLNAGVSGLTGGILDPLSYLGRQADKVNTAGRALFDHSAGGAWLPVNQQLASNVFTPMLRAGQEAAEANYYRALDPLDQIVKQGGNQQAMMRATTQAGEGFERAARQTLAGAGYAPEEIDQIVGLASGEANRVRNATLQGERQTGVLSKEVQDLPDWLIGAQQAAHAAGEVLPAHLQSLPAAQYVPRTINDLNDTGALMRRQRDALSGISSFQIGREDALKGLGGTVAINDLVKNPEFTGAGRTLTDHEVERALAKQLTGYDIGNFPIDNAFPAQWSGTSWGRDAWEGAKKQVKDLSAKLKNYSDPVREKGLFTEDLLGNLKSRELESARVRSSGETILAGLDPKMGQVQPVSALQASGEKFVRVPEFLDAAGLSHTEGGVHVAGERVGQMLGLNQQQMQKLRSSLGDYGLPESVANDMLRIGQAWKTPEVLKPVVDAWDKITQTIKSNLTYPFPGFHTRNVMSGLFNMWRDNALSPSAMKQMSEIQRGGQLSEEAATKLYPGLSASEATRQFRNELMANKISFVRGGQVNDVVGPTSAIKGGFLPGELPDVGGEPISLLQGAKSVGSAYAPTKGHLNPLDTENFFMTRGGTAVGNSAEDWLRGSHYLAKRMQGASPAEAKLGTLKYQIDYNDLSQFEKNVMKRVFPFYSFSRRNLPPLLDDLANRPAKIAGGIRASTSRQDNEFTPEWISEGTAIPVGKSPEGFSRYVNSLGMPYEDEAVKAIGNLMAGKGSRALQTTIGQTSNLLKFPLEQATGVQLHTGRNLKDLRPSPAVSELGDLIQGAGLDHPSTQSEQLLSELTAATPFSRFATTAGKMTDTRKGVGTKLLNLLTGTNVTDVDIPKLQQIAARDEIMDMLRGSPNVRHFEEFNVPKEKIGQLTPQELHAYELYRAAEKQAKDAAALRKKNQELLNGPIGTN